MSRYPRDLDKLMKLVAGPPLILKLLRGTQGTGVIFAESKASVESMLETIWSLGEDIMIQRFIAESKGKDIRVLVIDGEVRAAMRRIGAEGSSVQHPPRRRRRAGQALEGVRAGRREGRDGGGAAACRRRHP
jgi:glutathione synthase/RimK-type ligase-like ATP-grasp enzyme